MSLARLLMVSLVLLLLLMILPKPAHAADTDVVITEILADDTVEGTEWVEIFNRGTGSVDLAGWSFKEETDTYEALSVYQGSSTLASGEYAVITEYAATFVTNHPTYTGTIFETAGAIVLTDGTDEIGLYNGVSEINAFVYSGFLANDKSYERRDPWTTNEFNSANWSEHATSSSPGVQNTNYNSIQSFLVTTSTDTPTQGQNFTITITAKDGADGAGNTVTTYFNTVTLSVSSGFTINPTTLDITTGGTASGTFSVGGSTGACTISVKDSDGLNHTGSKNVTVQPPATATATGPIGYENTTSITLTYNYTGAPDNVGLYYTTDGGTSWNPALTDTSVDGENVWTAPGAGTYGWIAVANGGGSTETSPTGGDPPEAENLIIDLTAPTVSATTPANGETDVPANQNVVIQFSETMDTTTPTLTQTAGTVVTYTDPTWSKTTHDNDTATWTHASWTAGESVTLKVSGYKDLAGNVGSDNVWSFTTASDFSVTALPDSVTVMRGGEDLTEIKVENGGPIGTVTLSVSGLPSGVTVEWPDGYTGTPPFTKTLKFKASGTADIGTVTCTVKGEGDSLTQYENISLGVAAFDYSVFVVDDNLLLVRGETKGTTIRVSQVAGEQGSVSLENSGWVAEPEGVTVDLNTSSDTPNYERSIIFTASSAAEGGSFLYRVVATGGGISREANIRITINVGLALTLTTKLDGVVENSFEKGQTIQISGTVRDPKGNLVENGTATIKLTCESLIQQDDVQIENGVYSDDYQISFADPSGTWTITVTAVDNLNNTGAEIKLIGVGVPVGKLDYTLVISLPKMGASYSRGQVVRFSIELTTKEGLPVKNADEVYFTHPSGEKIKLNEWDSVNAPGVYVIDYTLGWADPLGTWTISVEGTKTEENIPKRGVAPIVFEVKPVQLQLSLESPVGRVEVGESVEIRVKITYPDEGGPVEDAVVIITTPAGENLTLTHQGSGIYSTTHTITPKDVGSWSLDITAFNGTDIIGKNLGSQTSSIEVASMGAGRVVTTYWWAFLAIFAAIGVSSAYLTRRTILVRRLKRVRKEMREIPKLKKEVMIKYFKEGSIERDTYDELMDKHDMRLGELRKQEERLSTKVGKKVKAKKARGKRKRR